MLDIVHLRFAVTSPLKDRSLAFRARQFIGSDDFELAVGPFHHRGAMFDPVTGVAVQHIVDRADFRMMDMATHDASAVA